jgi:membrane fusion protein (multidrug efflux system)
MESIMLKTNYFARLKSESLLCAREFSRRHLRFRLTLVTVGAVLATGCGSMALPPAGPPDVQIVQVVQKDVPITKDWVATLDGMVNANIRAQVAGLLIKQNYTNGAFVKKGTPLFSIDPRPFQAALDAANGNLNQANADLQVANAKLGKAELDVTRYRPLVKQGAISQQEMDDAVQADLAAKAQVEAATAAISSSQAALENAKINLGFTKISSPIDGMAGIAAAQVGDFVGPQGGVLTTISTVNPILANFTASEQEYLNAMSQIWRKGLSEDDALRRLVWHLRLTNGTAYPETGRFYALDRQVDIKTGAILVQVQFPNPGNVLRPGGYGGISTVTSIQSGALLIPQRAASELQGGFVVAVVGSDNKVHIQPVKMGSKFGEMWIVTEGLQAGQRVVAEGVQKVRDGTLVNPKPYQAGPATAENN